MGKSLANAIEGALSHLNRVSAQSLLESASPSMRPVEAVIRELAQSEVTVLLLAEHGAGKHATAQRIHELSRRSAQSIVCFRCSSLTPEELDAVYGNGSAGTVFFDEVSELNPPSQLRLRDALLRGAEQGSAARVICGSSRDLEIEVKAGRLREDLYYRISGVCLRLPPLRQRREDIPSLTASFLERYALEYRRAVPELSPDTVRLFQEYSWPGNLRELEDAARVLVALGDEQLAMGGLRTLLQKQHSNQHNGISLKAASRAASQEAEKELILNALTRTRWNRRRAAQELQISYKALLYKLKQIGCEGYSTP
jgi:two-component system, NtrC family, response regulator AtoC